MPRTKTIISEKSSGNVFEDLGFTDAKERYVKVELCFKIASLIQNKRLKQVDAAELLCVSQPKVSKLLHGKTDDFSIDKLMELLTKLGQDIEIVVKKPKPRSRRSGVIRVRVA